MLAGLICQSQKCVSFMVVIIVIGGQLTRLQMLTKESVLVCVMIMEMMLTIFDPAVRHRLRVMEQLFLKR